jgi:hypothetical protein
MSHGTNLRAAVDAARLEEVEAAFLGGDAALLGSLSSTAVMSLEDRRRTAADWRGQASGPLMARTVRTTSRRCC